MTDEMIENGENRVYEVGYLLLPSVPEERLQSEVSKIKSLISAAKGTLISEEDPQYRPLAYEMMKRSSAGIQRYNEAYFGWIKFETEAGQLPLLKEKLDKEDIVLRYLLVKTVREDTFRSPQKESHKDDQMHDEVAAVRDEQKDQEGNEPATVEAEPTATPEELDKSIDALVAE